VEIVNVASAESLRGADADENPGANAGNKRACLEGAVRVGVRLTCPR
jgi:hypothetical protein